MEYDKTWVRVDHVKRHYTLFENDGSPFTLNGAYMSYQYFEKLKVLMPEITDYTSSVK